MAVSAKRVRVSDDSGSNWYTLPGNTAELSNEAGPIDDTVFGQNFASSEIGLIAGSITAAAFFKGFAGYVCDLKKGGTPTAVTAGATTNTSGKTYRLNDAAKRVIDRTASITVKDGGSAIAGSNIESYDYLFGTVTFISSYTVGGAITMDYTYIPMANIASAQSFTLTQTADAIDDTDFDAAQANSGHRTYDAGLKTVSLDISGIYNATNAWRTALASRGVIMCEINPDGSGASVARGFFKITTQGQSGDVGALEEESITLELHVPDDALMAYPFSWVHTNSTLSTAVQKILTAWLAGTELDVQYLPNGTAGVKYDAIVTDISLSGGLDQMNEFSCTFQGSGAPSAVT
jgi:hypothetical protein